MEQFFSKKTRDRVLASSLILFNERGFSNVTTASIAKHANVLEGSLWYHFNTKKDLLAEHVKILTNVFSNENVYVPGISLIQRNRDTNKIYLSYSAKNKNNKSTLILSSAELKNDSLENQKVIFEAIAPRRTSVHMGAKIAFMQDGTLLLNSGDGFDHREKAQYLDNHFGKIIRINTDGSVPQDNPFVNTTGALPEIYSYGHRNMQGLIVTSSGDIYENEHGPKGGDEMNLIKPSLNYGWPAITYGIDYSGAVISPFTEKEGMEQPLLHWTPSIAPSDMVYYEDDLYPEFIGSFLVTALVSKDVKKVTFVNGKDKQESLFSDLNERLRNIEISPAGFIYLLTDGPGGKLIKVLPQE